ncbi:MAG: hypothetical protein IIB56_17580 [Planctomycetes bacterium]|nr:hypothetical protein [Planctomycetota bacterium]
MIFLMSFLSRFEPASRIGYFFYGYLSFHLSSFVKAKNLSSGGIPSSTNRRKSDTRYKRQPPHLIAGGSWPHARIELNFLSEIESIRAACAGRTAKGSIWMISTEDLIIAAALRCEVK